MTKCFHIHCLLLPSQPLSGGEWAGVTSQMNLSKVNMSTLGPGGPTSQSRCYWFNAAHRLLLTTPFSRPLTASFSTWNLRSICVLLFIPGVSLSLLLENSVPQVRLPEAGSCAAILSVECQLGLSAGVSGGRGGSAQMCRCGWPLCGQRSGS